MNRCTGHCCEKFNLSVSFNRLMVMRKEVDQNIYTGNFNKEEIIKVSDMLIPLGKSYIDWNDRAMIDVGVDSANTFEPIQIGEIVCLQTEYFTCKHYGKENKNCLNYDNRPNMCKAHGCNSRCEYKNCTLNKSLC